MQSLPAILSSLFLNNKNKAVIGFLALINLHKFHLQTSRETEVREAVIRERAYIPMIELLVICLKDHDSDFFPLYELALKLLAQIADAKKSPELKQQLVLGGYMQLMLVAFSQTELELPVVL